MSVGEISQSESVIYFTTSHSESRESAFSAKLPTRIRESSENIRSREIFSRPPRSFFIASNVFSSISKPCSETNLNARKMRSASSRKRFSGSPTHRRSLFSRSFRPPKRSIILPSSVPVTDIAIAFTVKSRLERSSPRFRVNETLSG